MVVRDPASLFEGYGLGLAMIDTPAGRLLGCPGGIPGFLSIVVSTLTAAGSSGSWSTR